MERVNERCARCGAEITFGAQVCASCGGPRGPEVSSTHVYGENAKEVEAVAKALLKQVSAPRTPAQTNLWVSGSFWLGLLAVVVLLLLAIARFVAWWQFAAVVLATVVVMYVVGSLVLLHERTLSQENFMALTKLIFQKIALINSWIGRGSHPESEAPDT